MTIDLDDGLVLYQAYNASAGATLRDDSGKGNTGTTHNMSSANCVTGISGGALEFNGTDEYVNYYNNDCLQVTTQSISVWIKTSVSGAYVFASRNDTVGGGNLFVDNDKLVFIINSTVSTAANTTVTDGLWHHVCVTFDDVTNAVKYYVDGVPDGVTTNTATFDHTVNKLVGYRVSGSASHYFEGTIDELRIYSRVLTETEVAWLHNHPSGVHTDVPSGRACFTDTDGEGHTISDMISLDVDSVMTSAADSFSIELLNTADRYAWLKQGCEIEIQMGMDGINTKKLTGIVTDVGRSLDSNDIPFLSVSGQDWGYRVNRIYFSDRFYDMELSALVKAILVATDYTSGKTWREIAGLSTDISNIDATVFSTDVASFKWRSLAGAIKSIADSAGYDWYIDADKTLHFFDAGSTAISATITDTDLTSPPSLTDVGEVVNRAIVVGGYDQRADQTGATQTTTSIITSSVALNESFVPTQDYLSSVLVWTQLNGSSSSDITLSVQANSGAAPDGINLAHGQLTVRLDAITDGGYTEFRFPDHVTLTPGSTYWLVLKGTDAQGQKLGVDGSNNLDYTTRMPSRIVIMDDNDVSQESYGMCMCPPYVDDRIEDPDLAEQMASEMMVLAPKTSADISRHGTDIDAGDVVQLTLTTPGVAVDKTMKVISSSWHVGEKFIENKLKLEEI